MQNGTDVGSGAGHWLVVLWTVEGTLDAEDDTIPSATSLVTPAQAGKRNPHSADIGA